MSKVKYIILTLIIISFFSEISYSIEVNKQNAPSPIDTSSSFLEIIKRRNNSVVIVSVGKKNNNLV